MSDPTSPAALEADIARTREDLARTVDELSTRLDPKRQAAEHAPLLAGIAGALVATVIVAVVLKRRRS